MSQGVLSTNPLFGGDKPDFTRLAGLGAAAVVQSFTKTGITAAQTSAINFVPPATIGVYRFSGYLAVTSWTTPASFSVQVVFKSQRGSETVTTVLWDFDGTAIVSLVTAVRRYAVLPITFETDASATAITVSTTGTFTGSPVYNLQLVLERLV